MIRTTRNRHTGGVALESSLGLGLPKIFATLGKETNKNLLGEPVCDDRPLRGPLLT